MSPATRSPDEPRSAAPPKFFAPLPPRKPADLAALAFADAPMPPIRPADLILASKSGQADAAVVTPSNKSFGPAPLRGPLPPMITSGVDRAPTGALALAEGASSQTYGDTELLARAAALTAPLPPMPIASAAVTPAATDETATAPDKAAALQTHGWVVRTATLAADDLAQLFGRLPFGGSK